MQDFSEKNIVYARISSIFGGKGLLFAQRCERKFEGAPFGVVVEITTNSFPQKKQNTPEKTCFV